MHGVHPQSTDAWNSVARRFEGHSKHDADAPQSHFSRDTPSIAYRDKHARQAFPEAQEFELILS